MTSDNSIETTPVNSSQPKRDEVSTSNDGAALVALPHGVTLHDCKVLSDDRGTLCEMFNPEWNWSEKPLTYSYYFTIRPGMIKGWGVHFKHEDRYFILAGDVELVLWDDRPDSPTKDEVFEIYLSDQDRRTVNIPEGVYHASRNIGTNDAVIVNFPTQLYDRSNPEKYRLPLDSDRVPYSFRSRPGW
ncbi:polysaccharide biosynthesis C-terminal domain-containing protein [Gordonia rubripertincta]|uniref:dTDP-4-dehydrorhamnose 3,5-epimerase family protein n=1 Tax=Gordonia rubripertincta TaxID=36822 RepID=A0ABT4N021_GORRU|nr:dTDP-4-dehydrorhamnose 3,5-epimerase family protein [Gordonia rubripertincta]MCZ4551806.1 dTDP-4-dehydrorhamnose 3,5-epimerase family protein [Gordonia rubripertincta]